MDTGLTEQVLALPMEERSALMGKIAASINRDVVAMMRGRNDDLTTLFNLAAVAVDIDAVDMRSRKAEQVMARAFVAKSLHDRGRSVMKIAKAFRQEHSTIMNLIRNLEFALGNYGGDDVRAAWKRFNTLCDEIDK